MPLYNFLLLIAAIFGVLFATLVFVFGKEKKSKNVLAIYNLTFSFWCLCQYFGEISASKSSVLFWTRANLFFAVLIPYFYLLFVFVFLDKVSKLKKILYLFGFLTIFLLTLIPTKYFVVDLYTTSFFKYYPKGGVAYNFFLVLFFSEILVGLKDILSAWRNSYGQRRNQISYIILASLLGFGGGVLWFLPAFGFDIYPFGIFITPFYLVAGAYAVVKHRLMDIRIAIKSWIIYSLIIALFTSMYYAISLLLLSFFNFDFGIFPTLLVLLFFSILFDPIKTLFQKIVNKYIFGENYDYNLAVKELSFAAASSLSMAQLATLSTEKLGRFLGIYDMAFYLFDEKTKKCKLIKSIDGFSHIFQEIYAVYFTKKIANKVVFVEELLDENLKKLFRSFNVNFFIPIFLKDDLMGLLLCGEKISKHALSKEDIDLVETFVLNVAITINNIVLSEKIMDSQFALYRAEKNSAISMIASELAHEIKNPLTSLAGLVQVFSDNISDLDFIQKFINIASRQIDRINHVLNKLINFEREYIKTNYDLDKNVAMIDISKTIQEVLKLCESQINMYSIKIITEFKNSIIIPFSEELFEQVVFNIVLNAIQAMPNGGLLKIKIEGNSLKISDTGLGIKCEDIDKIFEPFFTTKNNGTGLGLSIAKKILSSNNSEIKVFSTPNVGTTFEIIFNKNNMEGAKSA